jgi:hypothetical protein
MRQVVGEESGGVYALSLGEVSVDVVRSRARLTSLTVTTNDSLNGARPSPLPAISGTLRRCRATGIDVVSLVRGRFDASGLGCDDGEVEVGLTEGLHDSTSASDGATQPFVARLHEIGYRPTAPELRIDTIAFPALRISLRDHRAGGAGRDASLEQLSLRMYGVALGEGAAGAAERRRPLYSDGVVRSAEHRIALGVRSELELCDVERLCLPDASKRRTQLEAFLRKLGMQVPALSDALSESYLAHARLSRHLSQAGYEAGYDSEPPPAGTEDVP